MGIKSDIVVDNDFLAVAACIFVVLVFISGLLTIWGNHNDNASGERIEYIQTCKTIEDAELRTLCLKK